MGASPKRRCYGQGRDPCWKGKQYRHTNNTAASFYRFQLIYVFPGYFVPGGDAHQGVMRKPLARQQTATDYYATSGLYMAKDLDRDRSLQSNHIPNLRLFHVSFVISWVVTTGDSSADRVESSLQRCILPRPRTSARPLPIWLLL